MGVEHCFPMGLRPRARFARSRSSAINIYIIFIYFLLCFSQCYVPFSFSRDKISFIDAAKLTEGLWKSRSYIVPSCIRQLFFLEFQMNTFLSNLVTDDVGLAEVMVVYIR